MPEEGVLSLAGHGDAVAWLAAWDGMACISANTLGDGACGLHAVFGETHGSHLRWSDPNGRQRAAEALRAVVEGGPSEQARSIQTALWEELAVPGAGGKGGPESKLFWCSLLQMQPALCAQIEETVRQTEANAKHSEARKMKLKAVCRDSFLEASKELVVEPTCRAIGFLEEEGGALCYEERRHGQWVKGSDAKRPDGPSRPETKWEAVFDPDPVYDPLRTAVFLNPPDQEAVLGALEGLRVTCCMQIAEALRCLRASQQAVAGPPAHFVAEALPAYLAAVQNSSYYLTADELVAVSEF